MARRLLAAGLVSSNYATFVLKDEDVQRKLRLRRDEEEARVGGGGDGTPRDEQLSVERCRETIRQAQQASREVAWMS